MSRAGQSGRRGLGRGLGALIPTQPPAQESSEGSTSDDTATPSSRTPAEAAVHESSSGESAGQSTTSRSADAGSGSGSATTPGAAARDAETADGVVPVAGATFAEVPVDRVRPNPRQPREVFDEDAMAELVHSISEIGLLQPVVVRPVSGEDDADYELVMGERRWRATREAGLDVIPAIVRSTDDTDMLRDALLENLHRSQLNPLEEAAAYGQLLEDFGCTHEELAQRIGRSRPQISNTLRLLRLTPAVQRRVAAGVLSAGHARALVGVEDSDAQDRLAQRVVAEGISVRGLEELVSVGSEDERPARTTRRRPTAPGLTELSDRLADRLETRVKIDLGKSRGKIVVDFATLEDLQRIVDIMDPRNRSDRAI